MSANQRSLGVEVRKRSWDGLIGLKITPRLVHSVTSCETRLVLALLKEGIIGPACFAGNGHEARCFNQGFWKRVVFGVGLWVGST